MLKRTVPGVLLVFLSITVSAQQNSDQSSSLIQWKGSVNLIGEYSNYTPAFSAIPSTYGYLSSDQKMVIEGIPFQGHLFLPSYRASSMTRYSLSFDSDAMQQIVQERVKQRISSLQEIPSIGAMQERLDNIEAPEQYHEMSALNEKIQDGKIELEPTAEYGSILKLQDQLARYNPDEYSKYEEYLLLKSLEQKQDYRNNAKMLTEQGLLSSGEALWYKFDALQIGTTSPYFSDLDLAGVPVNGYYVAYSIPYLYIATASGTTLPFNIQDSLMSFSRNLRAYKVGIGSVANSHLYGSFVHGKDVEISSENPSVANTVGGIDGRMKFFKGKLDLQAKTYLSVYTSNMEVQAETNTIDPNEISRIKGLGKWLSKDVNLNSSTIAGNAHHFQLSIRDKDLHIAAEYRRVDPRYRSVGLAYLQSDVERIQLSVDKLIFNKKLRIYGKLRLDEDNLNGAKQYTGNNVNGILRIRSYFKKLPNLSLTYMPNFYSSSSFFKSEVATHKSHMLSLSASKTYRFLTLNQVSSGSLTYNTYQLPSSTFSSINTSINQMVELNKQLNTSLQLVYRQTNTSYYWSLMPTLRYKIAKRGDVHLSFRYGEDYFQNTRYALNIGTRLKINDKLLFGLSVIQNYYTQTSSISDLRVRSSLRAIW